MDNRVPEKQFFVPPGPLPLLPPCFPFSIFLVAFFTNFFLFPFSLNAFLFVSLVYIIPFLISYPLSFSSLLASSLFPSFSFSFYLHFTFFPSFVFLSTGKNPRWVDQVVLERPRNLSGQWPNTRNTVDRIIH